MRMTPHQFVALGAAVWVVLFLFMPVRFLLYTVPDMGLLICALATWFMQGRYPRFLLIAGSLCAGAAVALGMTQLLLWQHFSLTLLFGGLWVWYFCWGPGRYLWH